MLKYIAIQFEAIVLFTIIVEDCEDSSSQCILCKELETSSEFTVQLDEDCNISSEVIRFTTGTAVNKVAKPNYSISLQAVEYELLCAVLICIIVF